MNWNIRTPKDASESTKNRNSRAYVEAENEYRRGYWDGVNHAIEQRGVGVTSRQQKHWLWGALKLWRKKPLNSSPPPPTVEPWKKIRKRILKRDNYKCNYCGAKATHVDHVLAVANGGDYSDDNLVAACRKCNLDKGAKYLEDWRR